MKWLFVPLVALAACADPPVGRIQVPVVPEGSALFVGAGDVALCGLGTAFGTDPHQRTAALVAQYPADTRVFVLGDSAYAEGDDAEMGVCYDASWGRFKARTHPVPGNHEYRTPGATGYYKYFGPRVGDPKRGFYAVSVGKWRVLALNTSDNCREVSCAEGGEQVTWLKAELAEHPTRCTLAMFHHPPFSSNRHGANERILPMLKALVDGGVDLALAGHAHSYERFAPSDEHGNVRKDGLREFVVGTGGAELRTYYEKKAHSEKFQAREHGILELVLHPDRYDFRFISVSGRVLDQGSGDCH